MYNDKGDTFLAKYKVLEKIGEGSFSDVLRCSHKTTGAFYAAKRLKKYYKSESAILTCAELVAAQKVPFHPNILNLFEYHYDSFSGQVTFVFELMDMSLYDHLKLRSGKLEAKGRGIPEQRSKEYLYQLLRGLEHLHRNGLFHRDVKPENILIKFPSIESARLHKVRKYELIKLADLGSVRGIYSVPPYTEYISTRWYRSPECLLSNGNYGPKMDVWATGCVFYEMMTLLPLFPGTNEIDQLYKIHYVLGSPTMQFLSKLKSRSRNCVVFPKTRGTGIESLLPHVSRKTKGILELMIEYDPDKRVNVRRLLKNPYFDDIRAKFEPIMEGQGPQLKSTSSHKVPEYGKRSHGDVSAVKHKIIKRDGSSKDSKRRSNRGSQSSDSSKGSTPSIEIPYYTPSRISSGKHASLALVDFKLSRYKENNNSVRSSESNNSSGAGRKSSIKKSVEIILKSSRNSSESGKHSSSKEKVDPSTFHSKSLLIPSKNVYQVDAQPRFVKSLKSTSKRCRKYNKSFT